MISVTAAPSPDGLRTRSISNHSCSSFQLSIVLTAIFEMLKYQNPRTNRSDRTMQSAASLYYWNRLTINVSLFCQLCVLWDFSVLTF